MIQWDEVTSQPVFELSMCGNDDLRLTLVTPAGAAAICQAASKLCAASHCCCSPCFISCLQMHHAPQILCTLRHTAALYGSTFRVVLSAASNVASAFRHCNGRAFRRGCRLLL